ncbi:uncharacterized protein LOC129311690 isoform X2 [Prosopis cineraria]|uniref:uncharacterized protein LOC129311690 isoform X2 n=1 Tax=Prosopis cineraria TaxID=364024 RepID=UPI00240FBE51|nr:uncharacterized protein LOC129311690 isoform X2 [Prosopis cineraria]
MAAEIGAGAATKCTEVLLDKVMKELQYLCCYKSYAADYEQKKLELSAMVRSVDIKIEEAKTRNETQIDPMVEHWVRRAKQLIGRETRPKKWFGFCTDCFSQCSLAMELESMTQEIPTIVEKVENFSQVAHAAKHPGMEFYSQEFMHFKSRDSKFKQLREELKDGNKCRIALQAMGGSGKTTMAKEVGKEVENSKAFDKVIFIEVPNPIDEKKIRDEIAKKLDLGLKDDKERTHAEQIWSRIASAGNVLIILDDVWKELKLENIGIHHGIHTHGRCCILITTRNGTVCSSMRCQKTIKLEELAEEDAVDLFLSHAIESGNDCRDRVKVPASKIVNKCGRLPIIVVAVAKTLRNQDPKEWEDAFAATEKDASLRYGNADEEAKKFYNSLRLSFNYLDARAQDLFLLCSIFPRAYDISVELLSRIAIGSGLCGNVDSYCIARSQVLSIKTILVSSALLLTAQEGYVKLHDVIRDVAQQIADEKVQVIMDSETKLKENVKYSSWIINDFSNYFEGSKLEVLLVWVNANGSLEVPDAFFDSMKGLRVLLLYSRIMSGRTLASSLPKSIQSLENIQTLSLTNWKLGDISILQNLKKLQTLELTDCSITELPTDVSRLEKLRLLGLVRCSVERNNPFEVIGRCSKLEVLYYLSNDVNLNIDAKPSKITVLQEFGIYHIEGEFSWCSFQLDGSIKRYFNSTTLKGILSESTVKSLAARAEILELTECDETRWTNLIPDMIHIEDGGMNDLSRLCLRSWPAIQCLICTNDIHSDATIFSNLVELQLHDMHVRELCRGDYPNDFLKQLEKLGLSQCVELEGTLFKGKLELANLKYIEVVDCSMTCLFHPSTTQSLKQLENVYIRGCSKLECLISNEGLAELQKVNDHQDPNQKNYHSIFSRLKFLEVRECHGLKFILPTCSCKELESMKIYECNELKYIFGQCPEEGGLYQMEKEIMLPILKGIKIANTPKFINIYAECYLPQPSQVKKSWGNLCYFLPKSSALSRDDPALSESIQPDHTQASKEKNVVNRAYGLFTPPFYPYKNLRKMRIEGFSELKSLFNLSVASSLNLLEKLEVISCNAMEQIVIDEWHGHYHMNGSSTGSIFPNLQRIKVSEAEKLKYVFGQRHPNQKHNVHMELNLPAFKELYLDDVPNMISICSENYYVKALSLQGTSLEKCPQLPLKTIIDLSVDVRKRPDLSRIKASKAKSIPSTTHEYFTPTSYHCNLREIEITGSSDLTSLFTLSIASSLKLLERLEVKECNALEHIVTDEGHGHDHINGSSVFPKLQRVIVDSCNHLEYIFPAFYSKDLKDLEYVDIAKAERLKYVFGKCHADQNHSDQIELNLPALKNLYLIDVPNMVHICTENYHVKALYVECISLEGCAQLLIRTLTDFLEGGHKRQDFSRKKALSLKEKGKPLSDKQEVTDFRDKSMGPKSYLSFRNLSTLEMEGCKRLKFILSASTSRSMPKLRCLIVSNCGELVSIIEDEENEISRECFPELSKIEVRHCKKLRCILSMSKCGKLPQLMILIIEDAPELGQVFGWEQGMPKELMKDVLPRLFALKLINLPSLHTICQGIDFQNVKIRLVQKCPNVTLTSANASSSELYDVYMTLRNDQTNFADEGYPCRYDILHWAIKREEEEKESKEALEREKTISEQNNSSPEPANSEQTSKEVTENDPTIHKQNYCSETEEKGSPEDLRKDSTMPNQNDDDSPNLADNTDASTNEFVEQQLSSSHTAATSSNLDMERLELSVQKGSKLDGAIKENQIMNSKSSNASPTASITPRGNKSPHEAEATIGEGLSSEKHDTSKEKVDASVHGSPKLEEAGISNEVKDSEHRAMPAPFASPLQVETAQETVEETSVLKSQNSEEAVLADEVMDSKLSNIPSPFSSPFQIESPQIAKETMEPSVREGSKLDEAGKTDQIMHSDLNNTVPTKSVVPPENKSPHVNLVHKVSPSTNTQMISQWVPSISAHDKPQIETATTPLELESSHSDLPDISATTESAQDETWTDEENKFGKKSEQYEEHDHMRLFQITKEGADMEVYMPYVHKVIADLQHHDEVAKALADLVASLKMGLNEIATSEENRLGLEKALTILSSYCSEDGPPSHSLFQDAIDSMHHEIQSIFSSFNQAYDTMETFTKLQKKEKLMIEQHSQRKEAAAATLSEICRTENSMVEAQLKEAELNEHISKLQAELDSKKKEIEEFKIKLLYLEEQDKKSASDDIRFIMEFEEVKKEVSGMVETQMKARKQLENMDIKWSSCLSNFMKTTLLLGIHLKQKL